MLQTVRSFARVVRDEGVASALVETGAYALPSPYGERLSFTARFVEKAADAPLGWRTLLALYRHGFLPKSYVMYDFDANGIDAYLSDLAESEYGWAINRPAQRFLHDKGKFYDLLDDRGFGDLLPIRYGALEGGVLVGAGSDFTSLLREEGSLVVKGRGGATGEKVHICRFDAGEYVLDTDPISTSALRDRLAAFEGYLVTEYCRPADYARSLYPETPNTIRAVTMQPADGEPFLASAVHRIGGGPSGAVDNFSQGGLSAEVRDDGRLGPAVRVSDGTVSWHERHPDTGTPIAGVRVPGWEEIRDRLLRVAGSVPELRYVGWDLIVTDAGEFRIIEGNSNTDVDLLQAHRPLLTDPRVRSFYEAEGLA